MEYSVSLLRELDVEKIMARLSYIVVIAGIALTSILAEELYSSQYDDIDIHEIFNNSKLRNQYYNCFMETSPCRTADAKFFKGISDIQVYTEYFIFI